MPNVEINPPGTWCWFELGTSDSAAAKPFYEQLFGWTVRDVQVSPTMVYTTFLKNGRPAAAAYTLDEQMKSAGVPPHWLPYVCVESVDEMAKKAASLGGTVRTGPFDVMEHGRMAVISDTQGATFALWQPNKHAGIGIAGEPGSFAWAELLSPDVPKATTFYTSLFGWTAEQMAMSGMDYTLFSQGDRPVAGLFQTPEGNPAPPNWGVYWEVDDCDAIVAAAQAAGAKPLYPTMELDGVGRFAGLIDPQGAVFSVIKSSTRA